MSLAELMAIARTTVEDSLEEVEEKTGFRPDVGLTCKYLNLHCSKIANTSIQ
jgi:hypothetical protein